MCVSWYIFFISNLCKGYTYWVMDSKIKDEDAILEIEEFFELIAI